MTTTSLLSGMSSSCSNDTDIELLDKKDILASVAETSNILNAVAASLVIENEKVHRRSRIVCYPPVTVKTSNAVGSMISNFELNMIALSRLGEREQCPRPQSDSTVFQMVFPSILPATLSFGEYGKLLGLIMLALATFLLQITLLGGPLGVAISALLRYGGFVAALGISLLAIRLIFQEGWIKELAWPQKILLYTAGFLLIYELWILFSVVQSQVW